MGYYDSFDEAFSDWQDGVAVIRREGLDGAQYLVTQTDKGLNVYRAFQIGTKIALSVDLEGGDLADALGMAFDA